MEKANGPINVIWKRPDGFLGASPEDFTVVDVAGNSRIWLHRKDSRNFPFRVSGGWQDEDATRRLNQLVNMLNRPEADLTEHLLTDYYESSSGDGKQYLNALVAWLKDLMRNLKGDHWETTIMKEVMVELLQKIQAVEDHVVRAAAPSS